MPFLLNLIIRFVVALQVFPFTGEVPSILLRQGHQESNISRRTGKSKESDGYLAIISYGDRFLAAGTGGRIDYIDRAGKKTPVIASSHNNINSIISSNQAIVAVGDKGTILFSPDGSVFTGEESGTGNDINAVTLKNGLFIAGADNGLILVSKNGRSWNTIHPEISSNILSLTANRSYCIGITDNAEIIKSKDGIEWQVINYNKVYAGYNKSCSFRKVTATDSRIVIIGTHDDGSPSVLFSTLGNVWAERSLNYDDDQGMIRFLTSKPNGITYDSERDQFILACDSGEIFSLPSCTKCNTFARISGNDLYAIVCVENYLIAVGEGFSVSAMRL